VQSWFNGTLVGQQAINVVGSTVVTPVKLEMVTKVELGQFGVFHTITNTAYSGTIESVNTYLGEDYNLPLGSSLKLSGTSTTLNVWAKSTNPRYGANTNTGQNSTAADYVKHIDIVNSNTDLSANTFTVTELGSTAHYYAKANIETTAKGKQYAYVVAVLNNTFFYRGPDGNWYTKDTPLFSFNAPAVVNFDILRGLDTRYLPAGTALYVGYGASIQDIVSKGQYRLVHYWQ
jgi:hypothetical protein